MAARPVDAALARRELVLAATILVAFARLVERPDAFLIAGLLPVVMLVAGSTVIRSDELPGRPFEALLIPAALTGGSAAALHLVPAGLGLVLVPDLWWVGYLGGAAAMVGHAWPVFDHFRGGRSVLTWVGGAIVLSPLTAAVAIGALLMAWTISRSFAVAARVGIVAFPVAQLVVDGRYRTAATGALMCIFGLRFVMAWRRDAAL